MTGPAALLPSLELAVPLHMMNIRGQSAAWMREEATRCADVVAAHGDDILYRSARRGDTAAAFNALALGLAILAYAPGGVSFAGARWESRSRPGTDGEVPDEVRATIVDLGAGR